MSSPSEIAVASVCVAEFCQKLERRLAIDSAFVDCLRCRNWKTFSRDIVNCQVASNETTQEALRWFDARIT